MRTLFTRAICQSPKLPKGNGLLFKDPFNWLIISVTSPSCLQKTHFLSLSEAPFTECVSGTVPFTQSQPPLSVGPQQCFSLSIHTHGGSLANRALLRQNSGTETSVENCTVLRPGVTQGVTCPSLGWDVCVAVLCMVPDAILLLP